MTATVPSAMTKNASPTSPWVRMRSPAENRRSWIRGASVSSIAIGSGAKTGSERISANARSGT